MAITAERLQKLIDTHFRFGKLGYTKEEISVDTETKAFFKALERHLKSYEFLKEEKVDALYDLRQANDKIDDLQKQLREIKDKYEDLEVIYSNKTANLETEIGELEDSVDDLESQVEDLEKEIEELKSKS